MATPQHSHFCFLCYGSGGATQKKRSGWWPCTKQPCVKAMAAVCKDHETRRTEPRPEEG